MGVCAISAAMIAMFLGGCAGEQWDDSDPTVTRRLDDDFAVAAATHGVPVDLAKAVAYSETRWTMVVGEEEHEGHATRAGIFALHDANLELGAQTAGVSVELAQTDVTANIAAGTARLGALAVGTPAQGSLDLAAWAPVVEAFSQSDDPEVRSGYARDVYDVLVTGAEEIGEDGGLVSSIDPYPALEGLYSRGTPRAGGDYPGAVLRTSPNSSGRGGSSVDMIIIHTCEGNYASCWGWLKQSASGVSAHYVVKENGGEITQLVRESQKAWHIGATYACSRNSNTLCSKNGQSSNNFTIGIEHAGFASQSSWPEAQIEASAKLVCSIAKRNNIPRDAKHIVGHGQLQPANRSDPGRNWPWNHYISRVRAHCGDDGDTPADSPGTTTPPPSSGFTPIVIDSNQARNNDSVARMEITGSAWASMTSVSGYFGSGYWQASTTTANQPATFSFYVATSGPRTIDAWWTAGSNRSSTAPFIAYNASGSEVGRKEANQRTNGSQWVTLGTWNFTAGWNKVVLSRWASTGSVVVADAVRVR